MWGGSRWSRPDGERQGTAYLSPSHPGRRGLTRPPCPVYNGIEYTSAGRGQGPHRTPEGAARSSVLPSDALPNQPVVALAPRNRPHDAAAEGWVERRRPSLLPVGTSQPREKTAARKPAPVHGGDIDVHRQGHPRVSPPAAEPQRLPQDPLGRQLRGVPRHRARAPRGHPHRLPAPLRHDPVPRHRRGVREQGEGHPLQVLHRVRRPARRRHLRPGPAADAAGQRLQVGRQGLRHRAPRAAAARPGRQLQEHHRPPAQARPGGVLRAPTRACCSRFSWKGRRRHLAEVPDARGAAAPGAARAAAGAAGPAQRGPQARRLSRSRSSGDLCPFCRHDVQRAPGQVRRRLGPHARGRQGLPPDPVRAGPHRHRHLPAQGRKEPGLDRADRRHQLSQDRRVRHRQRSARLQLRRRAEHRQPRPGRVHRGAQARRGLPLRPARRLAGAQDQAEEVRPDRHRRGHSRPHQRAGISPAAEQRVHGSPSRPHGEDRRALRHPAARTRSRSTRRTSTPTASRASTSPRTPSRSRPCGRC